MVYYKCKREYLHIKRSIQVIECLPQIDLGRHLSYSLKCHFFITIIIANKSAKMIAIYLST